MNEIPQEHFNRLSAAEDERLAILSEECAEVIHAIAKIQRHGYESTNPDELRGPTNRQMLENELGDLTAAIRRVMSADDVSEARVQMRCGMKGRSIKTYLHHQPED